jgi:excinuclease ABC subunit C
MLDRNSRLIYVGKSKSLKSRLLSYFNPAVAKEKAGKIIENTHRIVWEVQHSEFSALLREQQLIRRWTPRWNVQEIPKRQRPVYLCLGRGPAACFFLSRLPPVESLGCEGPFQGAGRMGRAVEVLNKFFRLRDCKNSQPFYFSNQLSLFDDEHRPGCLRYEIGTCSGPCTGKVSLATYNQQVAAARDFLAGSSCEPLDHLQAEMARAAAGRHFERAAQTRDDLRALEYLHRKLLWLADARKRFTFIYSIHGSSGLGIWYFIRAGEIADVVPAPHSPQTYAAARNTLARWKTEATIANDRGYGPYPHTLSLVASWFRKFPDQLERTFHPAESGRKYRQLARSAVA